MKYNLVVIFLLIFAVAGFSYTVKGSGKAVIVNDDLKSAENQAKNAALIDAIYNYFSNAHPEQNTPDINEEFFKFVQKYRILNRYVKDFTVFYDIEAEIDDVAVTDAKYFINKITHSVVYLIENEQIDAEIKNKLKKILNEYLLSYNFSLQYQEDFEIITPENFSFEDKLANFGNNKSKYLFIISITPNITQLDSQYLCKLTTQLKIYSKKESLPLIKAETSSLGVSESEAIEIAFKKATENILKYVTSNLIKFEEIKSENINYNVTFLNFGNFSNLNKMLNFLKNKGFIESFTLKAYSRNQAAFDISSKFSPEKLSEKIVTYDNKVQIETENGDLIITFL
ncbi:MAG: hypothetical protein PWQ25_941 [Deferribacteres bacterium]|jgi:hypothetical protein|nr:hypothetical protein [Deferribacteres bacterium]